MAINVSFNGATIFKPGAYSKTTIDLGGGFPIGPAGLIAIFGEADGGAPGTDETDIAQNRFTADQLVTIRNKYRSGPIVDACNFLFAPGSDAAIPGGAQTVWIYKTNASVRAEHAATGGYMTIQAEEYGVTGDRITYTLTEDSDSTTATHTGSALAFGAVAEVTTITPVADVAGSLNNTYFTISSAADATSYYVWYNVAGGGVDPAPGGTGVEVAIATNDTADAIATATQGVMDLLADFSVVDNTGSFTVTNTAGGTATDAADTGATGFGIVVDTQGDDADGSALNGATFDLALDGSSTLTTITLSGSEGDHDSTADLALEIDGQLPAGMTCIESVGTPGALEISIDAAANDHQLGYGRSFELIETNAGDLALMGLTEAMYSATVEPYVSIALDHKVDNVQETDVLGGNIVLSLGHDGTGGVTDAAVSVTADSVILREDTGSGLADARTMLKSSFSTLSQLVDEINLRPGWTASTGNGSAGTGAIYNQLSPSVLDLVTDVGAFSAAGNMPARLKKDADDIRTFFELSFLTRLTGTEPTTGLPSAETEVALSGGAKGGTTSADVLDALDKFTKFHVNSVVPLFSRDAADDIADGLTDASSSYTIASIHQLVKTHISLMKTTKRKSERQGYMSFRGSYADAKESAGTLADGRFQLCIQDIRQTDSTGSIRWFQPWALSCLLAGARGGAAVGEPMTFKFLNCSGIRHTAQSLNTDEADIVADFDPDLQSDDAIQAGITFMEAPQTGGFRVVVDNTTYGRDNNFVFNRANVLYAADIVAFNFRNALENIYIGRKNTVGVSDIAGTASSILTGFLQQGITVSTSDAPQGFKNLTVEIDGNVIKVNVIIKIVEGIDFILSEITIQRATSA
jgi:hypothetical protein